MARRVIESRKERIVLGDIVRFAADIFCEFENHFSARVTNDDGVRRRARISTGRSVNIRDVNSCGWRGGISFGKKACA